METTSTFFANIFIGLKEGYEGEEYSLEQVEKILQEYCNTISYCVTITPTSYIYKNGRENGAIVGLINYPRFPSTPEEITTKAIEIATLLKVAFKQFRVSIVCSNNTYMLE